MCVCVCVCVFVCVRFRVHIKRQQAQSINISKHSSAFGNQLIRFSYAINMSHPQESGYMQATYKKRKHVKTYNLIQQLATNNTCVWFNGDLLHKHHKLF